MDNQRKQYRLSEGKGEVKVVYVVDPESQQRQSGDSPIKVYFRADEK